MCYFMKHTVTRTPTTAQWLKKRKTHMHSTCSPNTESYITMQRAKNKQRTRLLKRSSHALTMKSKMLISMRLDVLKLHEWKRETNISCCSTGKRFFFVFLLKVKQKKIWNEFRRCLNLLSHTHTHCNSVEFIYIQKPKGNVIVSVSESIRMYLSFVHRPHFGKKKREDERNT